MVLPRRIRDPLPVRCEQCRKPEPVLYKLKIANRIVYICPRCATSLVYELRYRPALLISKDCACELRMAGPASHG